MAVLWEVSNYECEYKFREGTDCELTIRIDKIPYKVRADIADAQATHKAGGDNNEYNLNTGKVCNIILSKCNWSVVEDIDMKDEDGEVKRLTPDQAKELFMDNLSSIEMTEFAMVVMTSLKKGESTTSEDSEE